MRPILIVLLLASPCAGVEIPDSAKVRNPGSYCLWACLQCLGKTHDIYPLTHILEEQVRDYPNGFPGYPELVTGRLESLGVDFIYQDLGSKKLDLLEHADKWGVVVALAGGNPHSKGCHAIIITSWGERVTFWDPNNPNHIYQCGRDWMTRWMNGEMVVVMKN